MGRRNTRRKRKLKGGSPKHVAIMFSGRIKNYEHNKAIIKAIQDKYKATVFCSINKKIKSDYIKQFCTDFDIKDEQINLEPTITPDWVKELSSTPETSHSNFYSNMYHKYKAFELIEKYQAKHKIHFDCVIFTRVEIDSSLSPTLDIKEVKPNTLYVPEPIYDYSGLNDQMAYGDFNTMKLYCNMVNEVKKMCHEQKVLFHPETMLLKHVQNIGVHLERFSHFYMFHARARNNNPAHNNHE